MTLAHDTERRHSAVPRRADSADVAHDASPARPEDVVREPGRPLEPGARQRMERAFGHDFGNVRVHTDERAAASAASIGSLAYNVGSHVAFGAGRYAPGTPAGDRLLAHELAHVVQRGGAPAPAGALTAPAGGLANGEPGTAALEADAAAAATAVAAGRAPVVRHRAAAVMAPLRDTGTTTAPESTSAPTQPAPRLPRTIEAPNVGRYGNLDASFDREAGGAGGPGWLTVRLRVKFVKNDSRRPWPSQAAFNAFVRRYCDQVMDRWSFKHFLVPVGDAPGEPRLVVVRVQVIPVQSGEHLTSNVLYTDDFHQSSVGGNRRTATLDQEDVESQNKGGFYTQTPGSHEFGHMLGLGHVHCNTNDDACYGTTPDERHDVMGSGDFVSPGAYQVFAEILRTLSGTPWRVQQASYLPTSQKAHVMGVAFGVGGALVGGVIGGAIGSAFGPLGMAIGAGIGALVGVVGGYFGGRALGRSMGG